jgi:voltage-gated potassium channel
MADETATSREVQREQIHAARWELLDHLVCLSRTPMTVLSFAWVGLLIVNLVSGLPPLLQWVSTAIWALFVLDFTVEVVVAPHRLTYVRGHWLTVISLALPAFSMLRILRVIRIVRLAAMSGSFSLLRVVTACNRGMVATRRVLGHHKLGYVATLTLLVTLSGAAGMYAFENPATLRAAGHGSAVHGGAGLHSYGEAVWWTAMIMTTMGSAYWPVTLAGRILCWLLALYAFAVFGYITATIASYFIGMTGDAGKEQNDGTPALDPAAMRRELTAIRQQLSALAGRFEADELPGGLTREVRPVPAAETGADPRRS